MIKSAIGSVPLVLTITAGAAHAQESTPSGTSDQGQGLQAGGLTGGGGDDASQQQLDQIMRLQGDSNEISSDASKILEQ